MHKKFKFLTLIFIITSLFIAQPTTVKAGKFGDEQEFSQERRTIRKHEHEQYNRTKITCKFLTVLFIVSMMPVVEAKDGPLATAGAKVGGAVGGGIGGSAGRSVGGVGGAIVGGGAGREVGERVGRKVGNAFDRGTAHGSGRTRGQRLNDAAQKDMRL